MQHIAVWVLVAAVVAAADPQTSHLRGTGAAVTTTETEATQPVEAGTPGAFEYVGCTCSSADNCTCSEPAIPDENATGVVELLRNQTSEMALWWRAGRAGGCACTWAGCGCGRVAGAGAGFGGPGWAYRCGGARGGGCGCGFAGCRCGGGRIGGCGALLLSEAAPEAGTESEAIGTDEVANSTAPPAEEAHAEATFLNQTVELWAHWGYSHASWGAGPYWGGGRFGHAGCSCGFVGCHCGGFRGGWGYGR